MIPQFKEGYRWLSNFAPVKIILDGIEYPSVEHAYMSAKSSLPSWKKFCSDPVNTAAVVKRASSQFNPLSTEWHEQTKREVMSLCLMQKFSQEPYMWMLLQTKNMYLQEGNYHNDTYWGVCLKTNTGENNLGKMIMEIRDQIRAQGPFKLPKPSIEHLPLDS